MSLKNENTEVNLNFREILNSYTGIANRKEVITCAYKTLVLFYMIISNTTGGSGTSLLPDGKHTSDGYEILKNIRIEDYDQFSNSIKRQLVTVVNKVSTESGDGTSTIITLLSLLYFSAMKYNLVLDYNKVHLDNAFEFVGKLLYKQLKEDSKEIDAESVKKALIIASNNNTKFGTKIFELMYGKITDKFSFETSIREDPEMEFNDIDFTLERFSGLQIPDNKEGFSIYQDMFAAIVEGRINDNYSIMQSKMIKYDFQDNDISLYLTGNDITKNHIMKLYDYCESKGLHLKVLLYQQAMPADIPPYLRDKNIFFNDICISVKNSHVVDMIREAGGSMPINIATLENILGVKTNDLGEVIDTGIEPTIDITDKYGKYKYVKLFNDGRIFLSPLTMKESEFDSKLHTRITNLVKQTTDKLTELKKRMANQTDDREVNIASHEYRELKSAHDSLFSEKINVNMTVGSGINTKKYTDLMDDALKVYKSLICNKRVVNGGLFSSYDAIYKLKSQINSMPEQAIKDHPEFNSMSHGKLRSLFSKVVGTIEVAFSNFIYDLLEKYDYTFDRTNFDSLSSLIKNDKVNPFAQGGALCMNLLTKEKSTDENPIVVPVPLVNEVMVLDSVFSTLTSILGITSAQLNPESRGALVKIGGKDPIPYVSSLGQTIYNVSIGYDESIREAEKIASVLDVTPAGRLVDDTKEVSDKNTTVDKKVDTKSDSKPTKQKPKPKVKEVVDAVDTTTKKPEVQKPYKIKSANDGNKDKLDHDAKLVKARKELHAKKARDKFIKDKKSKFDRKNNNKMRKGKA